MVQDQLVEYISSQLKLGISRDSVKSALTGVGWAPLDIEDTLKKVEGAAAAVPAQTPAQPKMADTAQKFVSFSGPGNIVGQAKNPEPQTIRVSDLVSASVATAPKIVSGTVAAGKPAVKNISPKESVSNITPMGDAMPGRKKFKIGLWGIIAIVLIVVLGAFAGYLFFKNGSLNSQLQAANKQGQTVSQSSAQQAQTLTTANNTLTAQTASLTATNQDLMTNLSFLAAPAGSVSTTETPISVSGMLSAGLGKNTYIITTSYGVKVSVKNSSVSMVATALQPLLGTVVQASGTYLPGSPLITIASVNGQSVLPAAATSSATSSVVSSVVATGTASSTSTH